MFCNLEEATSLVGDNFQDNLNEITNNYVVTNGSEPSTVFSNGQFKQLSPFKVKAIDSNGAGDIFAGSTLIKLLRAKVFFMLVNLETMPRLLLFKRRVLDYRK